jgi:hypothetical protein
MRPEIFESGIISSILAWLSALPLMLCAVTFVFTSFAKHEGIPRWFSIWLAICLFIFSPARYLLFLIVAADCYAVQSWGAFFSLLPLSLYVPIVFAILALIGVVLPMYSLVPILDKAPVFTVARGLLASVVLPVVCIVCSFIFYWALPYAAWTVHWRLETEDVIRATNGPTAIVYRYFSSIGTPIILPRFYDQTPQQPLDELRCHAATVFLRDSRKAYFVKHQYPEIYKKVIEGAATK